MTSPNPSSHETQEDIRSKLLYLKQWPDFSKEYDLVRVGDIARICALLARKPTVGFLVHRSVDMPSHKVEKVLRQLQESGCVDVFQTGRDTLKAQIQTMGEIFSDAGDVVPDAAAPQEEAAPPAMPTPAGSFLKRLWKKLLS
ncbi:hypothetical protein AAHN93_12605 [Vandammella animalimorsus]|uniref:hypothetical protein n=1 Tax=Vandammella animalimorsus TaxID=2029117 RepID=UPI0031BB9570